MFFYERTLRARSYLKIIDVAKGHCPGGLGHLNQKFDKKALFLHFQFLLASLR